jgi:hypothetical protein
MEAWRTHTHSMPIYNGCATALANGTENRLEREMQYENKDQLSGRNRKHSIYPVRRCICADAAKHAY